MRTKRIHKVSLLSATKGLYFHRMDHLEVAWPFLSNENVSHPKIFASSRLSGAG